MGLFYKVSDKELVKFRNEIFVQRGIPKLEENNFKQTPFPNHWFGKDGMGGYDYSLCRLSDNNTILEVISVHIIKDDRWIQIRLNTFELAKQPKSLDDFKELDGIKFDLPPNSITNMRLHVDDIKGISLFSYNFIFGGHKLKSFYTKSGLEKRIQELGNLIEKDCSNINHFVKKWHELYTPNITDWEGNVVG